MAERDVKRWSVPEIVNKIKRRTGYYKRQYRRQYPTVKDAVFIWIPKNGGTSMYQALKPHGMQYLDNEAAVRFYFPNKGLVSFGPLNYSHLRAKNLVNESFHQSAFRFAIVRNPYDRTVSSFFYFKQNKWIHPKMSFREFTYHINKIDFKKDCSSFNTYEGYLFPQLKYISNRDSLLTDFIARLENIHEDVEVIKQHLQLEFEFPRLNTTEHEYYKQYYCEDSKQNILKAYREDFEKLNYKTEL
ncbi:sulfotransferase family 2 domain-containing protein [Carboxylicivirga sediminis]|uniref:Sulfotransferase family 2 domain-containing protein n=1 Tax=Carboxylicivirga sediminis TaxID=2006564 RepID=A0A941IX99_9BACT|nr:sulfotransferase family 2 domain-containing protein [Carboxylicivirga sediminis]MBR8534447.1 sulfotransferase family 2 domain-containing protein [Carboxylicivirga sediminis]